MCAGYSCVSTAVLDFDTSLATAQMAQWFANCYNASDSGPRLCGYLDTELLEAELTKNQVDDWVCDTATEADFEGGARDLNAAKGVMGCGTFDNEDIEWNVSVLPGTIWEVCLWSLPAAGAFDEPSVVVDACLSFPVE